MAGSILWVLYAVVAGLLLLNAYHYSKVRSLEREISNLRRESEQLKKQVLRLRQKVSAS
jgi:phage shock protein A